MAGDISPIPREARPYQGQRAGLVTRTIAGAIDAVVVIALLLAGYVAVNGLLFLVDPRGFRFTEASPLLSATAGLLVLVLYLSVAWSVTGRSYGCHVMGLRVVSSRGRRLRPHVALLRAVFCSLFPIGLLLGAGGRRHRSLQDVVLRTSVIYDWRPRLPNKEFTMSDTNPQAAKQLPPQSSTTEVQTPPWTSPWVGWILFAGVMMIILGLFHAFQGFIALFDDEYYLVGRSGLSIHLDYPVWGWIHLTLSAVVLAAGIALLNGRMWGRVVGVILAVLSVQVNAGFLAAFPIWSTIMIAVDILVIWALSVHGHEMRTMVERGGTVSRG